MTVTYVLMQNLRRNPLRTALTIAAFAFPMAVFVAAISLVLMLVRISEVNQKQLRLAVHHKITLTNLLPEGIRRKIEELDPDRNRLAAVCGMRWFGGRVPDTQNTLTSLAADADTFPIVYADLKLTEEEIEAWQNDRTAAVAGIGPALQHQWKVGSRVTLSSVIPPYLSLEFRVVKIMSETERSNLFYFRRDYLEEAYEDANFPSHACNIFWIKCHTSDALGSLQREIDATFANTPHETKSEDENAFLASFTQAAGDIPGLMQAMAIVVVVIIALVAGNTMMMSFRERTRELAVFKAIGFQARRVFAIVLAESVLLALVGAALGVLPTALALALFPIRRLGMGPITTLSVSPMAVAGSLLIALVVGMAAGLWPAYCAMRLHTVDALRRVA